MHMILQTSQLCLTNSLALVSHYFNDIRAFRDPIFFFFSGNSHLVKSFVLVGSEWQVLGEKTSYVLYMGTNDCTKGEESNNCDVIVTVLMLFSWW